MALILSPVGKGEAESLPLTVVAIGSIPYPLDRLRAGFTGVRLSRTGLFRNPRYAASLWLSPRVLGCR